MQTAIISEKLVSINPATGETLGEVAIQSVAEVADCIERARQAQKHWSQIPMRTRAHQLRQVGKYLVTHTDQITDTISRENGKTRAEALASEVLTAAMAVDYYTRMAPRWQKPGRLGMSSLMSSYKQSTVHRVPYGVVGIISPWNYPFAIPFHEIILALLAGNAVILKGASETPLVTQEIAEALTAASLPDDLFAVVTLPGHQAGPAFLDHGVDKLNFTGSVAVGKFLMAKAAEYLTPLSLELGGNDAMIICADANLKRAAAGAVWAGLQNAGQACGSIERILVHEEVLDPFLQELQSQVGALTVGDPQQPDTGMGVITTRSQWQTIKTHLDDAVQRGARILVQSKNPVLEYPFFPATVLVDVTPDMLLMREETFGPLLAVIPVKDMETAVELANATSLGLTGSIWTNDRLRGRVLARKLAAGVVTVNDHLISHGLPETPWGGFRESGLGRTHGQEGFNSMTQLQTVVDDRLPFLHRYPWWPPYSAAQYDELKGVLNLFFGSSWSARFRGLRAASGLLPGMLKKINRKHESGMIKMVS